MKISFIMGNCIVLGTLIAMEEQSSLSPAIFKELEAYHANSELKRWSKLTLEEEVEYIKKGKMLYKTIVNNRNEKQDSFDRVTELKNRIALCWFFYAIALAQKTPYYNGTIVLEDTQQESLFSYFYQYVENTTDEAHKKSCWIATNPFSYQRSSSHFLKEQKKYPHYGIDIRTSPAAWSSPDLPSGCRHILFGKLDEEKKKFFIKMEDRGIHYSEVPYHVLGVGESVTRKLLPYTLGKDVASKIIRLNDGMYCQKEHLPLDIIALYKAACKMTQCQYKSLHTIAQITQEITTLIEGNPEQRPFKTLQAILKEQYTHPEQRYGNEIIILLEEGIEFV